MNTRSFTMTWSDGATEAGSFEQLFRWRRNSATAFEEMSAVTDVAAAFVAAAESEFTGRYWNLGAGKPQSVNRLIELLGGETVHIPKRPGEPDCTWADISRITQELGWSPKVTFEEGVSRILAEIEYWREAPLWDPASIETATQSWHRYMAKT